MAKKHEMNFSEVDYMNINKYLETYLKHFASVARHIASCSMNFGLTILGKETWNELCRSRLLVH